MGRLRRGARAPGRRASLAPAPSGARRRRSGGDGQRRRRGVPAGFPGGRRRRRVLCREGGRRRPHGGDRRAGGLGGAPGRARGRVAGLPARRALAHQVPRARSLRRAPRPLLLLEPGRAVQRRDGQLPDHRRRDSADRQRRDRGLDGAGPARRRAGRLATRAVPLGRGRRARRVPLRRRRARLAPESPRHRRGALLRVGGRVRVRARPGRRAPLRSGTVARQALRHPELLPEQVRLPGGMGEFHQAPGLARDARGAGTAAPGHRRRDGRRDRGRPLSGRRRRGRLRRGDGGGHASSRTARRPRGSSRQWRRRFPRRP